MTTAERQAAPSLYHIEVSRYSSRDAGFRHTWPTGFAGTGWQVVHNGVPVYRAAFRYDALAFMERLVIAISERDAERGGLAYDEPRAVPNLADLECATCGAIGCTCLATPRDRRNA